MARAAQNTKPSNDLVVTKNQPPAELMDYLDQDAGRGVTQSANDVGIPFLGILQDLSPQVKRRDEAYIEGAEVGMLLNTQTKKIYDGEKGILFIPCFFKSCMVEWRPDRGGWAGEHTMDTPLAQEVRITDKGERIIKNGNSLDETKYYYGFFVDEDEGTLEAAVVSMSKSMLKSSREWQGIMKRIKTSSGLQAPSFSRQYQLRSHLTKKNNNEWFVWTVEDRGWVDGKTYALARELAQQCENGMVRAAQPEGTLQEVEEEVL